MTKPTRSKDGRRKAGTVPKETLLAQASPFQAEIRRTPHREWAVLLAGTNSIEEYRPEFVCLCTAAGRICVVGQDLRMVTYASGCVEVIGKMEAVQFKEGRQ